MQRGAARVAWRVIVRLRGAPRMHAEGSPRGAVRCGALAVQRGASWVCAHGRHCRVTAASLHGTTALLQRDSWRAVSRGCLVAAWARATSATTRARGSRHSRPVEGRWAEQLSRGRTLQQCRSMLAGIGRAGPRRRLGAWTATGGGVIIFPKNIAGSSNFSGRYDSTKTRVA